MKVAIYIRVSTDRQVIEGSSMEDQLNRCRDWVKRGGHVVAREYVEPGVSAYDEGRLVFEEMIDDAATKPPPYDAILVYSYSRFYRDDVMMALTIRKLAKFQVRVISVSETLPQEKAGQDLMLGVIGIIARYQSTENSKAVTRCQRLNATLGYFNGSRPPFGYKTLKLDLPARSGCKKKLVVDPEECETVRTIFRLAMDGMNGQILGCKKIAGYLNERGQKLRGRPWRKQTIYMILSNRVYIGKHTTFKHDVRNATIRPEAEWVVSEVPAIVDEATFRRAGAVLEQRGFAKREAKAKQSPTLLAGLMTCDLCGRRIRLINSKSGKYHYYTCATKSETSVTACDCPYLPRDVLDDVICSALSKELLSSKRLGSIIAELNAAIKRSAAPDFKRLQDAKRAMSTNAAKVAALYDEIGAGKLLLDGSLSAYLRDQQNQLATLKEEVETLTHRYQLPLRKFGRTQIAGFAAAAKDALLTPNSPLARGYLLATVAEIRVGRKTAVVSGGSLQLAATVAQWAPGITPTVPKLVSEWRARQDSNL